MGWLVHDEGASDYYNCEICRSKGWDQDRACFRFNDRDASNVVRIEGTSFAPTRHKTPKTPQQVWREVEELQQLAPQRHILFWLIDILGVCPEGLIDPEVRDWVQEEAMCDTYKTTPVSGGLDDQPALLYDAFKVIRRTHQEIQNEKRQKVASESK